MRKLLPIFLLVCIAFASCQEDEEMRYASIYFPLATWADGNGVFQAEFDFTKDTTYIVGAYCAGSIMPEGDILVTMELAADSLAAAQQKVSALQAYELMPQAAYSIQPENMQCVIRKGVERGDLLVTFHTSQLDADKKYILPLRIQSVSRYEIAPHYNTLFFGVSKH